MKEVSISFTLPMRHSWKHRNADSLEKQVIFHITG